MDRLRGMQVVVTERIVGWLRRMAPASPKAFILRTRATVVVRTVVADIAGNSDEDGLGDGGSGEWGLQICPWRRII